MSRAIRTAVAAAASHASRTQIIRSLAEAGVALECMCEDGASALRALSDFRPDLLAVDARLPILDGQSLARRALCGFELPVRPAVLLLRDGHYPLPEGDLLRHCGVAILDTPANPEAVASAMDLLRQSDVVFTEREKDHAESLLDALGFPPHPGRDCLKLAALHCAADQRLLHNLGARLYPRIGETFGMDVHRVERAMRHVIDLAWQSDKFDNQYRIFADTVDAGRGQPTCGEMISRLADILRMEG